ncbi:hypothetical protein EV175_002834 [Coemansia sp. RSA 1933]|nr:hypothetical protein EV175_002834 [Coemansia sp. RSA 1933]
MTGYLSPNIMESWAAYKESNSKVMTLKHENLLKWLKGNHDLAKTPLDVEIVNATSKGKHHLLQLHHKKYDDSDKKSLDAVAELKETMFVIGADLHDFNKKFDELVMRAELTDLPYVLRLYNASMPVNIRLERMTKNINNLTTAKQVAKQVNDTYGQLVSGKDAATTAENGRKTEPMDVDAAMFKCHGGGIKFNPRFYKMG